MKEITLEDFQKYFDEYLEQVEDGESFIIQTDNGNVVVLPLEEYEELLRACNKLPD